MNIVFIFITIYVIYWASCIVGIICYKNKVDFAIKIGAFIYNQRIDMFNKGIFRHYYFAIEHRKFLMAVFWLMSINIFSVIINLVLGVVFVSPIYAIIIGFMTGLITAQNNKSDLYKFAIPTLVVELAAFSSAGAIGIIIGNGIFKAFSFIGTIPNGYWYIYLLPIVFLFLNGIIESGGLIFFGAKGAVSIEAVKNKLKK